MMPATLFRLILVELVLLVIFALTDARSREALPVVVYLVGELRSPSHRALPDRETSTEFSADPASPLAAQLEERIASWLEPGQELTLREEPSLLPEQVLKVRTRRGLGVWVTAVRDATSGAEPSSASLHLKLYFSLAEPPAATRYLSREVMLAGALNEVGQEQLAQIIASSARALAEGDLATSAEEMNRELTASRIDTADRSEAAVSPPARREPRRAGSGDGAEDGQGSKGSSSEGVASRGAGTPFAGMGVATTYQGVDGWRLSPLVEGALRFGADAAVRVRLRFDVHRTREVASTRVQLWGSGAELGLSTVVVDGRYELGLGWNLGADWVRFDPVAAAAGWQVRPVTSAELRLAHDLLGASAWCLLQARALLSDPHYRLQAGDGFERIASPWRVSPALALGLSWPGDG